MEAVEGLALIGSRIRPWCRSMCRAARSYCICIPYVDKVCNCWKIDRIGGEVGDVVDYISCLVMGL